jgi:hypothetical protein
MGENFESRSSALPASEQRPRSHAAQGVGSLVQRDYWAVIANCAIPPNRFGELLAERFPEFSPDALARFRVPEGHTGSLSVGDVFEVDIRMAGTFGLRVLHRNDNSITLATLEGHPESGRITFGAYRSERGDVVFHIRSRARSSSRMHLTEYFTAGEGMQTATWAGFINAVARHAGEGVLGDLVAKSEKVEDSPDDDGDGPTYIARGD